MTPQKRRVLEEQYRAQNTYRSLQAVYAAIGELENVQQSSKESIFSGQRHTDTAVHSLLLYSHLKTCFVEIARAFLSELPMWEGLSASDASDYRERVQELLESFAV